MKKVIRVDEYPPVKDAFMLIFPAEDYEITMYADAMPLLNNAYSIPDLFIIDKQLPGVEGLDLCRFIKQRPETKNIPVIILSASPNIKLLAKKAGADESLEKPFRVQVLREAVSASWRNNLL